MWTDREVRSMAVDSVENKSNLKVFENIVDKDGHKRFIEDDITLEAQEGLTSTYAKWALSGSHLLIVIAGTVTNGSTINGKMCDIDLPQWIKDKIIPIASNVVSTYTLSLRSSDNTTQGVWCALYKTGDDKVQVHTGSLTLTADRNFRAEFDLLIDNA